MIKTSQLCKTFREGKGRRQISIEALKNISLEANDGEVTAILGSNGAGKTTLLRIIVGLDSADSGDLVIDNQALNIARKGLGYLSDGCGLYQRLTAFENISYFAKLYGVSAEETKTRIETLSHYLKLDEFLYRRVEGFSKGQLMRVNIARSLIHDPQTIILDEPTNGLDLLTVRSLRNYLRYLSCPEGGNKCVIISTHQMHEVEKIADKVVMVSRGEVITTGTVAEICAKTSQYDLEEAFVKLTSIEAD